MKIVGERSQVGHRAWQNEMRTVDTRKKEEVVRRDFLDSLSNDYSGYAFFMETVANAADVPRITKEQLKSMLGDPNVIIIDVRIARHWKESDSKIKGAVREDPGAQAPKITEADTWMAKYQKDKTLVFYCQVTQREYQCQFGTEIPGQRLHEGLRAERGLKEWLSAGYPTEPK